MNTATIHMPDVITKDLALGKCASGRRIVLSSNYLLGHGFLPDVRTEQVASNDGIRITCNPNGATKIYKRSYKQRRANPTEAQVDLRNQTLINSVFPSYTERAHIAISAGEIFMRPLPNLTFSIRETLKKANSLEAFVAMTSGVDVHCLNSTGFNVSSVLEYRPNEKRDYNKKIGKWNDKTESGALCVTANSTPRLLISQDVMRVDWQDVEKRLQDAPPVALLHMSLQCDDFSNIKANSLKDRDINNLQTSMDMVFDAVDMVKTVRPGCIMLEQVPGFGKSDIGKAFAVRLRRLGYHITETVMEGREHGGLTLRKRYYLVASLWPGFTAPAPEPVSTTAIWPIITPYLDGCRDVSHTRALAKGLETGRARIIDKSSAVSPTLLKSQSHDASDNIVIFDGERYLMPSVELLQCLQGIPDDFNLDVTSKDLAIEVIGQSVDYPMHHRLSQAVHEHLVQNIGAHTAVNISPEPSFHTPQASTILMPKSGDLHTQQAFLF